MGTRRALGTGRNWSRWLVWVNFKPKTPVPGVQRGSKLGGHLEPADAATLAWEESWQLSFRGTCMTGPRSKMLRVGKRETLAGCVHT